jgi:hypothetical protein
MIVYCQDNEITVSKRMRVNSNLWGYICQAAVAVSCSPQITSSAVCAAEKGFAIFQRTSFCLNFYTGEEETEPRVIFWVIERAARTPFGRPKINKGACTRAKLNERQKTKTASGPSLFADCTFCGVMATLRRENWFYRYRHVYYIWEKRQ